MEKSNKELEATRKHLVQKAAELELTSKYKSEFLANMSHELRTPLNAIIGFTDMVLGEKAGKLNTVQKKMLNRSKRASKTLFTLLSDVMDITLIDAKKAPFTPELIDMAPFLHAAVEAVEQRPRFASRVRQRSSQARLSAHRPPARSRRRSPKPGRRAGAARVRWPGLARPGCGLRRAARGQRGRVREDAKRAMIMEETEAAVDEIVGTYDVQIVYESPIESILLLGDLETVAPRLVLRNEKGTEKIEVPMADLEWWRHRTLLVQRRRRDLLPQPGRHPPRHSGLRRFLFRRACGAAHRGRRGPTVRSHLQPDRGWRTIPDSQECRGERAGAGTDRPRLGQRGRKPDIESRPGPLDSKETT